jgi:hypothetical protein
MAPVDQFEKEVGVTIRVQQIATLGISLLQTGRPPTRLPAKGLNRSRGNGSFAVALDVG